MGRFFVDGSEGMGVFLCFGRIFGLDISKVVGFYIFVNCFLVKLEWVNLKCKVRDGVFC